jgi:hypothetical protein
MGIAMFHAAPQTILKQRSTTARYKARRARMPHMDGDFETRVLVPLAHLCARMASHEAANEYRLSIRKKVKRWRRSKEGEAAVLAVMSFIDPTGPKEVYALEETIIRRGKGKFRRTSLVRAITELENYGLLRAFRVIDGLATNKRIRVLNQGAAIAIIKAVDWEIRRAAMAVILRQPFARAAFPRGIDLADYIESMHDDRQRLVEEMLAQCGELMADESQRELGARRGGFELLSQREDVLGRPIIGWDRGPFGKSGVTPLRDNQPPSANAVGKKQEGPGPGASAGLEDSHLTSIEEDGEENNDERCERCEEEKGARAMTNLTGRPVLTKAEEIAKNALDKQQRRVASGKATTRDRTANLEGPDEATIATIRQTARERGCDMERVEEFLARVKGYAWKGKTQAQVNAKVNEWFAGDLAINKFTEREKPNVPRGFNSADLGKAFTELCGSSDQSAWREKLKVAGVGHYADAAMMGAVKMAETYLTATPKPGEPDPWAGVKKIAHELGSCLCLWQIADMHTSPDALTISVMHPQAAPSMKLMASERHVEMVSKVLAAATGRKVVAMPYKEPWVRMSQRELFGGSL